MIVCDSGLCYMMKFWDDEYFVKIDLTFYDVALVDFLLFFDDDMVVIVVCC